MRDACIGVVGVIEEAKLKLLFVLGGWPMVRSSSIVKKLFSQSSSMFVTFITIM